MEKNGGMVAVVQGLRDANLTVTLLDGGKQYTLMPNNHAPQPNPAQLQCHVTVNSGSQYAPEECPSSTTRRNRENGIQATDGSYASTYKMMHCNLNPTSPPQTVTEFPPQRPEVLHGHGNFVIGGCGSGEAGRPAAKSSSFRGGMVWPDKGSVCASRASIQSDAFANSLRKYPNITPERSTEIVERLISFTQAKNLSKFQNRCPCPPTRNSVDSESSRQTFILEGNCSKNSIIGKTLYRPEVSITSKKKNSDSPTRMRSSNYLLEENDTWKRPFYNDVRYFRETSRKVKQEFKSVTTSPLSQSHKSSSTRLKGHYDCEFYHRQMYEQESNNSVNMEIQAAAQMETKEILTLPRIVPMQRTIATSLSPIPSKVEARIKEKFKSGLSSRTGCKNAYSCKSIQATLPLDAYIRTTSSSFDLRNNKYGNKSNKRSRSDEELGNTKKSKNNSIISILHEFNNNCDLNEIFSNVKTPICKKKICQNCKHLYDNFDILRRSVSNNTYFHEGLQFNIDQQETSKHFIEMSKHYHINGNYRVNKLYNRMQPKLAYQPEYLSYVDTSNNIRISTKPGNGSRSIQFDTADFMYKSVNGERWDSNHLYKNNKHYNEDFGNEINKNCKILPLTHGEIRNLIDLDILAFTEKYRINISTESLYNLNEKLFDLFVMDLNNNTLFVNKKKLTEKIKKVLQNTGLSEFQSVCLTKILVEHWEEEFLTNNTLRCNSSHFKSEALIVLPNITQDSSQYKHDGHSSNDNCDFSINEISQKDIDANVAKYLDQISNEINDWLSNLRILDAQDEEVLQAIINDLATDIVDRHKYLELNSFSELSETSELEHLKYQIFKLIYKFGIDGMTLIDRAHELLKRIQSIAVPTFSLQERQLATVKKSISKAEPIQYSQRQSVVEQTNLDASTSPQFTSDKQCCEQTKYKRNHSNKITPDVISGRNISVKEPGPSNQASTSTKDMCSLAKLASVKTESNKLEETPQDESYAANVPTSQNKYSKNGFSCNRSTLFSGGIKINDDESDNDTQTKLTDESDISKSYNQYLKDWVEKIPLPMKNAEDKKIAEIARNDIYNGVLEAVSKLKSDRDTFNDRFLYEDKLDDEIEKLISKLPQSPELSSKKHIYKVKLIEKTSNVNDFMKSSTKSYKQQLVENLQDKLPKPTCCENVNADILEIYEDLQILNIVEDFIISSRYQNEDPIIAEAYRKKLLKRTENFIEELKANHCKALKNIDIQLYLENILDSLKNVPLPSNETIKEELEEILLCIEIDKWFSDLPLIQNNELVEQLHRRRLRSNLAKQILDIEKGVDNTGSAMLDNSLKQEISQFLGKAPLHRGESLNINVMVDDLIERLKNRPTSIGNDIKKVAFNEPEYEEFSQNMPLCSTCIGDPYENIQTANKTTPGTKSTQEVNASQQDHSGHYHDISKPQLDDIRTVEISCNTDFPLQEKPHYEMFDNTRPGSSTLKDDIEPHWYTLHESRHGHQQPNISFNNIRNQSKTGQSNKSIQVISPSEQTQSRHYHNIAKPLLDDLNLNPNYSNDELANDGQETLLPNGDIDSNWYTLQESKQQEYSLPNKIKSRRESSHFVPYPVNTSQQITHQDRCSGPEYNIPQQGFLLPQYYSKNADPNDYAVEQRHDLPCKSSRKSPRRVSDINASMSRGSREVDARRSIDNHTVEQKWPNSYSPDNSGRQDNPILNQRSPRLDHIPGPQRTQYYPSSTKELNRHVSNRSQRFQSLNEERHNGAPQINQSELFHRSTDRDGIRQTIERNKCVEANCMPPEALTEYYQPTFLIPRGYVPVRVGMKKGVHMADINIDGRREEESEEDNEEDENRCRCLEKLWKSKRKHRYCPFEQYDGFPTCLTSPYFYPYFC